MAVFALAGIFTASAQIWLGGSANIIANKEVSAFEIAPEIGYSIPKTKWAMAIAIDFIYARNDIMSTHLPSICSPYIRYRICDIEKFSLFMDLTGDFPDYVFGGYRVGLQPGIVWMATKHWTAAFRFAFLGYNDSPYYNALGYADGFNLKFGTTASSFGLYYNF